MKKALRRLILYAFLLAELIPSAAFAYTSPVYRARSSPPEFEVDSIAPKKGPGWGGTIVTIYGKKFLPNSAFEVRFGGIPGTNVKRVDNQTMTVKSPRHPLITLSPDTLQVTVTDLGEKTNVVKVSPDSFIYVRPGTKLSLLPASALYNGTVELNATLTDSLNAPVDSQTVIFTLGGVLAGMAITDTSGLAKLSVSVSGVEAGVYAGYIGAGFQENFFYKSSIPVQADLTVKAVQAILTLNSPVVNYGEGIELKAVLTSSGTPLIGKTVFFSVNNNPAGSVVTQNDGSASLTLNQPFDAGQYAIKAAFAEQGYDTISASGTLTINKAATSITVQKVETSSGSITSLTAKLTANGNAVKNAAIIFTIDGSIPAGTAMTNDEGAATLSGVSLGTLGIGPGTHSVSAGFAGNTNYKQSSASNGLIVSQEATVISISGFEADYGSTVALSAKLTSKTTGLGIKGAIINFAIEGGPQIESAATNESGEASKSVKLGNTSPGPHNLTASFAGNGSYGPSQASAVITVKQQTPAATNILVEKSEGSFGGKTTLSAKLTNSSGTGLSGLKLHFKLNGADIGDTLTNALGVAQMHGVSIAGIDAGLHENFIEAGFSGNSQYLASSASNSLTVMQASTNLSAADAEADYGGKVTLSALLISTVTQSGIADKSVSFIIQGGPQVTAVTNGSGVAAASVDLGSTSAGTHDVTASFSPSGGNYKGSTAKGKLTVKGFTTSLAVTDLTGSYGGTVTLEAALYSAGAGLQGKTIKFRFNNKTYSAETNYKGIANVAEVSIAGFEVGKHSGVITAEFAGTGGYGYSSASGSLRVEKASTAISVANVTGTSGGKVDLSATLTSGGSRLQGLTVRFELSSNPAGEAKTNDLGVATLYGVTLPGGLSAGPHPGAIAAVFDGNNNYMPVQGSGTLTITQTPTAIVVNRASGSYGGKVNLAAKLTGASGIPLNGMKLHFKLNGTDINDAYTDEKGMAVLTGVSIAGINAGLYDNYIQVVFSPLNNDNAPSTGYGNLEVSPAATTISISNMEAGFGSTVTLTARLTSDVTGNGVENRTIIFKIDGAELGNGTTGADGKAAKNYYLANTSPGYHTIEAFFSPSGANFLPSSGKGSLEVGLAPTSLKMEKVTAAYGAKVTLAAVLTSQGAPISGKVIEFSINDKPVGSVVTDVNGIAVKTDVDLTGIPAGSYPGYVGASFAEANPFKGCSSRGDLEIKKAATAVAVLPVEVQYSDQVSLTAVVISAAQELLNSSGGRIEFKCQTGSETAFSLGVETSYSVVSGKLNFSFTFICTLAPNTYKILAVFTPSEQANFEVSCNISPWGPLVVKPEDALAEYSGVRYFSAASLSDYTSLLTFYSTVRDYPDASSGNISNAKAEFREVQTGELYGQGIIRGTNLPVSLLNSSDEAIGSVTAQPFSRELSQSEINNCGATFSVYTRIYGYYHALSDPALVSVCIPSTENISGGGFIIPNSPSGKYRCQAGSKASFGFSMKYSKTGKDAQGQVNIIVHAEDNKIYQITANSISTLSAYLIQGLPGKAASFTTRAELRDITDPSKPVFLGGGLALSLEIYDDEKDNQNDAVAITLQDPGSALLFSSNWDGSKTASQTLKAPKGGGTIRVLSIDKPVGVEEEEIVPKEYALYQNYPNPFNPSTNIKFDLPEESRVSIVIYNILGREVVRLVDKDFPAGRHQAVWNLQYDRGTFASGIYILRISAKSLSSQKSLIATKKMMLVK